MGSSTICRSAFSSFLPLQTATYVVDSTQNTYCLQGRYENGVYILYMSGQSRILAYNTLTLTTRVLMTAVPGTWFRCVSFSPQVRLVSSVFKATQCYNSANEGSLPAAKERFLAAHVIL